MAAGDFNGDARLDLVTDSWAEDRLVVILGDGKGGFITPGMYVPVGKHPYQRVRVADLNGDGKADIVSPNLEGDNVTILLGDGKGNFGSPRVRRFPAVILRSMSPSATSMVTASPTWRLSTRRAARRIEQAKTG